LAWNKRKADGYQFKKDSNGKFISNKTNKK
jgi:hypothetical protein